MKTFLIRGVPASIQQDSWWMDGNIPRPPGGRGRPHGLGRAPLHRAALLAALIALADVLLWQAAPGLSLAIFGLCLQISALAMMGGRGWGGVILGALFALPLIEQPQSLSLAFWATGLITGTAWIALAGWQGLRTLFHAAMRLIYMAPARSLRGLGRGLLLVGASGSFVETLKHMARGWALPGIIGLIFLNLLLLANPLVEQWAQGIENIIESEKARLAFWGGMALLIYPFLNLMGMRNKLQSPSSPHFGPRHLPGIVNASAIRRSLGLFNFLFLIQTLADMAFLWAGTALPEGMTYAQYAHRGAYPLLAAALLAGAFALVARPFTDNDRILHFALLFWMAQTVLLTLSSLLRLELYIEVYGLTRLRLAAGIWMALVAVSLGLVIWQILARRSAGWLLLRASVLGLTTLYATLFLSFDRTIANYNFANPVPLDPAYICALGPAARPAITRYNLRYRTQFCQDTLMPPIPQMNDWREWGFRDWRVLRSLDKIHSRGAPL